MTSTTERFTNITDIKRANKAVGFFWFSPDTVRLFKSRVETRIYDAGISVDHPQGSRLWVESTTNWDDSAREYKIARFDVRGSDISYVSADWQTLRFNSKRAAMETLEGLL